MKIKKMKINSFGKLQNKELELKDNINIIYGKNESGKSTILKFILGCLYGTSKNKKGKDISDFERYKPWDGEDYSGKLEYKLDNGESFEVYREFNKKNPKIFNEKLEDISKTFNIDKTKGNQFFYDQTKIDEDLFLSTSAILQQEVKIEKNMQNILIQKIANLIGTGEDNVSYKRAIERINRKQLEEIGTERSREKPINIVSREIEEIKQEKQELEIYKESKYEIEENKKQIIKEIEQKEEENNCLQEIKKIQENIKIENEKIKIQENIKNNNTQKINLLKNDLINLENNKKEKIEKNNKKNEELKNKNKKIKNIFIILFFIIILLNILQFIFIKNKLFNYIFLLTVPTVLIFYYLFKNKLNKKEKNNLINLEEEKNKIINIKNEINIIEKNNKNLEEEINKLKNNNNLKINLEKEKIKNKYINKINKNKLFNFINNENINNLLLNIQNEINNNKLKLHSLDLDKENIEPKLDNLANLEERLEQLYEQYVNLNKINSSINLAKEVLNLSYEKMKDTVTPRFTQELSNTISQITNGKYINVKYDDERGLVTEVENGDYVLADRLSIGTIDQLYLSLRLSIINELTEEKVPLILDESFAYYDEQRLKNILKFINERFNNYQIIIFTCTEREKNILEELKIKYNFINLQ